MGRKNYELTDHLGNVNVVIGDERMGYVDGNEELANIIGIADGYGDAIWDAYLSLEKIDVEIVTAGDGVEWQLPVAGIPAYALPGTGGEHYAVDIDVEMGTASTVYLRVLDGIYVIGTATVTTDGVHSVAFDRPADGEVAITATSPDVGETFHIHGAKIRHNNGDGKADYYLASIRSAVDYYPFGWNMPGRLFSSGFYRHGFQGQEQDPEISGTGNSIHFTFRDYDPRIGRMRSIDPLAPKYPFYSPYAFSGNRVIDMVELEGLEPKRPWFYFPELVLPNPLTTQRQSETVLKIATYTEVNDLFIMGQRLLNVQDIRHLDGTLATPEDIANAYYAAALPVSGKLISKLDDFVKIPNKGKLALPPPSTVVDDLAKAPGTEALQKKADKLNQTDRSGKDFTKAGKDVVKEQNKLENGGQMHCEGCGIEVTPAKQHTKGYKPPSNEAHVDHKDAKSKGGSGTPDNGQVLCRGCNLGKSDD